MLADRCDLPGTDDEQVTGADFLDRDFFDGVPRRRCATRGIRSSRQVSSRPARPEAYSSSAFRPRASRRRHGDQKLAERKCVAIADQCDRVDTDVPARE
jgi:hypothetical protein